MAISDAARPARLPGRSQVMRELLAQGRSREAIAVGGEILGERGDPEEKAVAATQRLAAYFNIGQAGTAECRETEEQARELAREVGSPTAQGHFHALAAGLSSARGSADQALAHLLDSQRHLNAEQVVTPAAELAWYDLATTQGNLGLGDSVLASLRRLGQMTGVEGAWLSPRLDAALALDHVGDTRGAIAGLEEVIQHGRLHGVGGRGASGNGGRGGLRYWDAISCAYAAARLAVLSAESDADLRRLAVVDRGDGDDGGAGAGSRRLAVVDGAEDAGSRTLAVIEGRRRVDSLRLADDAITSALHLLIRACLAIAAHRPQEALAFLDRIGPECPLPVSELLRVRSLALTEAGDSSGAVALERQSFRIQSQRMYQLQRLMLAQPPCAEPGPEPVAGGEAWDLSSYVREALTDPLTGLPNRRHLERRLAELTAAGRPAALAVLDLDGFKQVNTVHGHVAGDRVLARIAALLAAALRTGDFVARYGGDEFVILLPDTACPEAHAIGARINAAITSADWHAIAPRTPIGASIGWTQLAAHRSPEAAIQAADQAMYAVKR